MGVCGCWFLSAHEFVWQEHHGASLAAFSNHKGNREVIRIALGFLRALAMPKSNHPTLLTLVPNVVAAIELYPESEGVAVAGFSVTWNLCMSTEGRCVCLITIDITVITQSLIVSSCHPWSHVVTHRFVSYCHLVSSIIAYCHLKISMFLVLHSTVTSFRSLSAVCHHHMCCVHQCLPPPLFVPLPVRVLCREQGRPRPCHHRSVGVGAAGRLGRRRAEDGPWLLDGRSSHAGRVRGAAAPPFHCVGRDGHL